jgi:DNA-binding MarR family transcriptional regulator
MSPQPENVVRLVTALFTVVGNLQRARKNVPDAASLAVLQIIGRGRPDRGVRPSEIAEALDVHRSAVTHHLRSLTAAGHITPQVDPLDRRSSLLFLTDEGSELVDRLAKKGMDRFQLFVAEWSDEDVLEMARLLEKFRDSAQAANEKEPPASAPDFRNR